MTELGWEPFRATLPLQKNGDYVLFLEKKDGSTWDTGTTAEIQIEDDDGFSATWSGSLSGDETRLEWHEQVADTNVVPNHASFRLVVTFPTSPDTTEQVLFVGRVRRSD